MEEEHTTNGEVSRLVPRKLEDPNHTPSLLHDDEMTKSGGGGRDGGWVCLATASIFFFLVDAPTAL